MEILENGIYIYIFYSISFKIYKYLLLSILDNFIFFADGGELPRRVRRIIRKGKMRIWRKIRIMRRKNIKDEEKKV